MIRRIRLMLVISITFGTLSFLACKASAEEDEAVITRQVWAADDNILAFEERYAFPTKVIVVPVVKKNKASSSRKDLQELYYYFAARSGIGDLPFHYVVASDGSIYSGNKLGDEAKTSLGGQEGAIVIGYIQSGEEGPNLSSVVALKNIILSSVNKYAINPDTLEVYGFEYKIDPRGEFEEVTLGSTSQKWEEEISLIRESVKSEYSPDKITFAAELVSILLPEDAQEVTKTAEIKIKVKNTGDFNFYGGASSNLFAARNDPFDAQSLFYLSEEWDSPSRVGLLDEGERLVVGEEKELTLNVYVPLHPPEKSEDFVLVDPKGEVISGSEFEIKLQILKPEKAIIEITDTPVGYLNVRETPSGYGTIVTKVSPGERFLVQDYQNGYYKIEANGKEGWVINMYVKVVS